MLYKEGNALPLTNKVTSPSNITESDVRRRCHGNALPYIAEGDVRRGNRLPPFYIAFGDVWAMHHFDTFSKLEVDHIVPRTLGGKDQYSNLLLFHKECHLKKTAPDMLSISKARRFRREDFALKVLQSKTKFSIYALPDKVTSPSAM